MNVYFGIKFLLASEKYDSFRVLDLTLDPNNFKINPIFMFGQQTDAYILRNSTNQRHRPINTALAYGTQSYRTANKSENVSYITTSHNHKMTISTL